MAYTCSFSDGNIEFKNKNCFFTFVRNVYPNEYILIEKEKIFYKKKLIKSYLNDLINFGFNFTYEIDDKKNIKIFTEKITSIFSRKFLCISLRFLWEGKYKKQIAYGENYDDFYIIFEHYNKIKKFFKDKFNTLEMLCIAKNCFIFSGFAYNPNHSFSNKNGCKILNKIDFESQDFINNTFEFLPIQYDSSHRRIDHPKIKSNYPKKVKNWKKETYEDLIYKIKNYHNL